MDMPQIAVKISDASFSRLKRLAHQGGVSYASVIESALTAYPGTSATSETASLIPGDAQTLIEQALAPVLSRLATLETGWTGTAPEAPHGPQDDEPESDYSQDESGPETGAEAGLTAAQDDNETSSSIPPKAPRAFADLPDEEKPHWRKLMLSWQGLGLSNAKIGERLWEEQKIGQWSFGKLARMDRNRVKVEIDRIKRG
jgi:hypothetical protein